MACIRVRILAEFFEFFPFRSKKFNHPSVLCVFMLSTIMHWCYVERTRLSGAPIIFVELDSVTIQWVWQQILPGAKFKLRGGTAFLLTFVLMPSCKMTDAAVWLKRNFWADLNSTGVKLQGNLSSGNGVVPCRQAQTWGNLRLRWQS